MTEQLSEQPTPGRHDLSAGTIVSLELPSGRPRTYVVLGDIAPKFRAGSRVIAELTRPDDGSISLGPMQPLPNSARPEVTGALPSDELAHSLEEQFGTFGAAVLHWVDGSGEDPWAAAGAAEH